MRVITKAEWINEIECAERSGILIDRIATMPKGPGHWDKRSLAHILGVCIHQNGSPNTTDPIKTAEYHTGPNHIAETGLPGICYDFAIPDTQDPPWLVSEIDDVTYAQGNPKLPGAENEHLISIIVMGGFDAPGYKGYTSGPTTNQTKKLIMLVEWLKRSFGFGDEGIFGHYHFGKAACPGYTLASWIELEREGSPDLDSVKDWQNALLTWNSNCLPKYGADGDWGNESRRALIAFQKAKHLQVTGLQDPFTELMLIRTTGWTQPADGK